MQLLTTPPYTEPYIRWCERTAGVTPPPTRSVINRGPLSLLMAVITQESGYAAEAFEARGMRVSVRTIRDHLGGGSPNLITPLLASWQKIVQDSEWSDPV